VDTPAGESIAEAGDVVIMQQLIESSGSPNNAVEAQNKVGDTALHLCARMGKVKCIELLLSAGAPLQRRNVAGHTVTEQLEQAVSAALATVCECIDVAVLALYVCCIHVVLTLYSRFARHPGCAMYYAKDGARSAQGALGEARTGEPATDGGYDCRY
jgi:hypothetical protein